MAIKIEKLIEKLEAYENQKAEVEFIVVKTDGKLVCMDIKSTAAGMVNLLGCFGGRDKK